jgi:pimeloyl-ACP methyl ester carboxylesterase
VIRNAGQVHEGVVGRDGVSIHYQVFGEGKRALLLLPTWSIVHSDFWRNQVSHFADRYTVLAFDGRGNGASDRPPAAADYGDDLFAADAVAVMDAVGVERAVSLSVSAGACWQLLLAAEHQDRMAAAVFIAPSLPLGEPLPERAAAAAAFDQPQGSYEGWLKFNRHYWNRDWPGFLRFFFAHCFTERDSDREIDHFVAMGLETSAEVIAKTVDAPGIDSARAEFLATAVECPVLVIHGGDDAISSVTRGQALARLTDAELVVMPGVGHEPQCRWPDEINRTLDGFLDRVHPAE